MAAATVFYHSPLFSADGRFILDRSALERPEGSFTLLCEKFSNASQPSVSWNVKLNCEKKSGALAFRLPDSVSIACQLTADQSHKYVNFMVKMEVRQEICDGVDVVSEHFAPWTCIDMASDPNGSANGYPKACPNPYPYANGYTIAYADLYPYTYAHPFAYPANAYGSFFLNTYGNCPANGDPYGGNPYGGNANGNKANGNKAATRQSDVVGELKLNPSIRKLHIRASATWRSQKNEVARAELIQEDPTNLIKKLQGLQSSGKLSDVVFVVGEEQIPAHSQILAAMSEVFSRMFERDTRERRTGRVEVTDASPAAFRCMLRSLYSGKEPDWSGTNDDDLLELAYLAHKYALEPLQAQCARRMVDTLREDNVCKVLEAASSLNLQRVKDHIVCYVKLNKNFLQRREWNNLSARYPNLAIEILTRIA